MKSFKKQMAQGDVFVRKVNDLPAGAVPVKGGGQVVVAHSETGHHHAFDAGENVFLYTTADAMVSYLEVKRPAVLKHLREWDTHEEVLFDAGVYEIRRQREAAPDGWRQVQD